MSPARALERGVLLLASLVGLVALLQPFFSPALSQAPATAMARAHDAPLITLVLVGLCLAAVLATLGSGEMNSKTVAVLGVLTAANAVLRAVPGPAGFAAVFMLPILCGYVYGGVFGFLLGALSILVSALIGAGVGPWLPFQMFITGWVGLTSSALARLGLRGHAEVLALGLWGVLWGFAFGALMNLWFWPFVFQPQQADMYWQPGLGLRETLARYGVFYLVTSVWWDLGRAAGNGLLIWLLGAPVLRLLRRFQARFRFRLEATRASLAEGPPH